MAPLREMFRAVDYPDLLVGLAAADDSAVYRLNDQQAIISTTVFFPPVVDDPYDYGAIAAANAMSDIYAMGGEVLFAINIVAFPDTLEKSILSEILRGGAEKVAEAGGIVVGGHSVNDKEPKYGMAVTGIIHPDAIKQKGGARPGDRLVLTKPLVNSMKRLNRQSSLAAVSASAHAMTDITGFGLLGHGHEMAHLGNVDFRFNLASIPWLDGAKEYGEAGAFPGGMGNNTTYFGRWVTFSSSINNLYRDLLFTPETSGGLLIAIPPEKLSTLQRLDAGAVDIGFVLPGNGQIWLDA